MPIGTILYNTLASTYIDAAAEAAYLVTSINMEPLVTGNNIIAVEIHQSSISSLDISFNLKLRNLTEAIRITSGSDTIRKYNDSLLETHNMIVYPNPNTGTFTVEVCYDNIKEESVMIEIFNPLGQSVYKTQSQKVNGCIIEKMELDSEMDGGAYILNLSAGSMLSSCRLLLIK